MTTSLIGISGASGGIGRTLARTVPWPGARVIGIGRHPLDGTEHLADLADPRSWPVVGSSFKEELARFDGERVVFIQAPGTLDPIGFAGEVEEGAYAANVLLNGAAPQVLGHPFLAAVREVDARRHLAILTSGAARSVYPGLTSYGAAKGRGPVGATRGPSRNCEAVSMLAIAPGTVDTGMQAQLRETSEKDLPKRQKFVDLHTGGKLSDPEESARQIWGLLDRGLDNGSVVDLREMALTLPG
ncbi:MAG: hypothetical protein ACRDJ4_14915 [Actinomycetota bacterium]